MKRYARDLEIANAYTENIMKSLLDTLIVIDPQGAIRSVNKATLDLLEYPEDELLGQPAGKILDDESPLVGPGFEKVVQEGTIRDDETIYRTKSGEEIPILFSSSAMTDTDGNLVGIVGVGRDMRESRLVKELEKANRELKEATMQLVQSEKLSALGELTAGVAHELNQPLNGIKIICQSLLRDIEKNRLEEEDVGNDLTDIVNQVNKMAEIIDHMRIYARHTEGEPNQMVDVNSVIEGPFKLLDQQLKTHNIEVVRELAVDLPKVHGDPIRLEQVLMNLITNARYALDGCGKENKRIEIRTYKANNHGSATENSTVAVEVKDNGGGIPDHLREKIFQPFFTTKDPGQGTGLGLSVSSKIIEEHKGRIEVESEVGRGTTFRVILPIAD
jgi:PAS domain S-box-containing protein